MSSPNQNTDHLDQPVYWFVLLDSARDRGDYEAAAEAKRELERLGVKVAFRRPSRRETAAR